MSGNRQTENQFSRWRLLINFRTNTESISVIVQQSWPKQLLHRHYTVVQLDYRWLSVRFLSV